MVWKACWLIVDVVSRLYCCELCIVMKMVISSLFVWTCHLHWFWDMIVIGGCTISRDVSRAAMDAWTNMSPMGPGLRDSGCVSLGQTCITILDIAFHCIAHLYYWWTWSCVLLILWVPFYGTLIDEYWACCWRYAIVRVLLLLRIWNYCCCWGYEIVRVLCWAMCFVNCELLCWAGTKQVVVVEVVIDEYLSLLLRIYDC